MKAPAQSHHARMQRVLDHIDRHLDEKLDVAELSRVAALSMYHFHRQFTATFGVPVQRYVQLARMKRASARLARFETESVTDIAMDVGYGAPDAFARAFRRRVGQSPSSFRKSPRWEPWLAAFRPLDEARNRLASTRFSAADVMVGDVPPTAVALMEHRGDPAMIHATITRFVAWRRASGLKPATSATFTVFHDDPRSAAPAEFRMDLCVATERVVEPNDHGVLAGLIPGGRCAVLRVAGMSDNLEPAALFLYRDWLPASGEEPRDFPLYCQRISFYPQVAEHEAVTDLYLPLR